MIELLPEAYPLSAGRRGGEGGSVRVDLFSKKRELI